MQKSGKTVKIPKKAVKIELNGKAMIEKSVKKSGNSGRVYVPVSWIGKKVKVVLLEDDDEE